MITIKIKDKLTDSLEYNSSATVFLDELSELYDDEIKVDFTGVTFISRSFAQEYYGKKLTIKKDIEDINVPEEVQVMFDIVKKGLSKK